MYDSVYQNGPVSSEIQNELFAIFLMAILSA